MKAHTMTELFHAISVATLAHEGQTDKSGMPYIAHPIAVMMKCKPHTLNMIVAVLHDTVEDTHITLDDIEHSFGLSVRHAVDAVSRRDGETYWDYLARCKRDPIATIVKVADLDHNLSPERQWTTGSEYLSMMKRYVDSIAFMLNGDDEQPF